MTNKVLNYISEYWSYDLKKLTINKSLDDLGMYGADKYDFIINFAKNFNLEIEKFPFDKYVKDKRIDFFGIDTLIKKYFLNKKIRKIGTIYISMLINAGAATTIAAMADKDKRYYLFIAAAGAGNFVGNEIRKNNVRKSAVIWKR